MEAAIRLSAYLQEALVFVKQDLASQADLFKQVHQAAFDLGYVREDFCDRVMAREATFPTGLQLEKIGVAIPHTDAECVHEEFVAVVTTTDPVTFQSMEDPSQSVAASLVFVLGLNQPHAQLEMLQSLMSLLQNDALLQDILQAETAQDILTIVKQNNL